MNPEPRAGVGPAPGADPASGMGSASGAGLAGVREPAVAGQFYPADPGALARMVEQLLDAVGVPDDDELAAAYVVPHAGYRYCGPTAAHVYARLRRHAGRVRRIVLVGPAHRVPLTGCAVPTTARWRTPLGEVPIDPAATVLAGATPAPGVTPAPGAGPAAGSRLAAADDAPHAPEHSLEVQLPFLQRVLGQRVPGGAVPVLPVAVGRSTVDEVIAVIAAAVAADRAGTVVLCSTDLSHYLPEAQAKEQDARTAAAVLALDPSRVGVRDACGVFALRGLLGWARGTGLTPSLLQLSTSADTGADPGRVVGYPAFALRG